MPQPVGDSRVVDLKNPFSSRTFTLSGSPRDLSVVGAIDSAGGIWEPEIMNLMASHIAPDDVCLDIGANVGVHTLIMAELASSGHVHAFEPSSVNFAHLSENIRANGFRNATPYHLGLCHVQGDREFHYFDDYAGCSMASGGGEGVDMDAVMTRAWGVSWRRVSETVSFTTLDDWAREVRLDRVDFIKMDVEGFERYVVEGGIETLRRFRPKLVTEFNIKSLHAYYGIDPRSYYDLLTTIYGSLTVIEADGQTTPVANYDALALRLSGTRFWADLFCVAAPT